MVARDMPRWPRSPLIFAADITAVCSNFIARMPVSDGHDPLFLVYLQRRTCIRFESMSGQSSRALEYRTSIVLRT